MNDSPTPESQPEARPDRVPTQLLRTTHIMVRDAQEAPMKWDRLDEHLRAWLGARATARELPPGVVAEDLVQEVLLEAYSKLPMFKVAPDASFRGWLVTLLDRRAHDLWRRHLAARRGGGKVQRLDSVVGATIEDLDQRGQHIEFELREERELLEQALGELREDYRAVLEVYGLQGRSSDEAAAELGYNSGISVRVKYKRAREKLIRAVDRLRNESGD